MQKINSTKELHEAILVLEETQSNDLNLLKLQLERVYESVQPINLIKSTIEQINESNEIKSDLLKAAVVVSTGFLSKALFNKVNNKVVNTVLSSSVALGVINAVINNPAVIKNVLIKVVGFFRKDRSDQTPGEEANNVTE